VIPWDLILTVLLGILTAVIAYSAYRLASKANTAQSNATKTAVDAEAYKRARELYESAIKTVEAEADRLRTEVTSLHDEVGRLRSINDTLTTEVRKLRREVAELKAAS
jgi:predicted RNase H-like nuclease (RuvC/YqgF family)